MDCTPPGVLDHLSCFLLWSSTPGAAIPLTHPVMLDRPSSAKPFPPLESMAGPRRQGPSIGDISLGTNVKHLTLILAVCKGRGRDSPDVEVVRKK